jgi:hypothetical protein
VTEKSRRLLGSSIALSLALLVTPGFAPGQGATSCFDSAVAVNHVLGENPETLREGVGSFHLSGPGTTGFNVHYARQQSFSSSSPPDAGRNRDA